MEGDGNSPSTPIILTINGACICVEPHGSCDVTAELRDNNGVEEDRDDNSGVAAVPDDSDAVVDLVYNDDAVVVQACSGGAEHHGSGAAVVEPQSAELPLDLLVTEPDPYSSWLGLTALSIP